MEQLDDCNVECEEIIIKNNEEKCSNSKIFKCLLKCLRNGDHNHMLKFVNEERNKFEVHLLNKKSSEWTEHNISLFIELDSVSSKCREKEKYAEKSKGRFKANMSKLNKYIKELSSVKKSKCLTIKTYEILKFPHEEVEKKSVDKWAGKADQCKNMKKFISKSHRTPVKDMHISNMSHYSCLSGEPLWKRECDPVLVSPSKRMKSFEQLFVVFPDKNITSVYVEDKNHSIIEDVNLNVFSDKNITPVYVEDKNHSIIQDVNLNVISDKNITPVYVEDKNHSIIEDVNLDVISDKNITPVYVEDKNHSIIEDVNLDVISDKNITPVYVEDKNHSIIEDVNLNVFSDKNITPVYVEDKNHSIIQDVNLDVISDKNITPVYVEDKNHSIIGDVTVDLSFLDDLYRNDDTEKYRGNMKGFENPLLSSTAEAEKNEGMSPNSGWITDFQEFDFERNFITNNADI